MKISLFAICQNVLSGCVGALLVIGIAHAQVPPTQKAYYATSFMLVDDKGQMRGGLAIDPQGNPILALDANEHKCIMRAGSDGCGLQVIGPQKHGASVEVKGKDDVSITAHASEVNFASLSVSKTRQNVVVSGEQSGCTVIDPTTKASAAMLLIRPDAKVQPLFSLTDETGHVTWQQR